MSEAKWTIVNGVRYENEQQPEPVQITSERVHKTQEPSVEEKNKEAAKQLYQKYGKPVSSTEVKKGLKRTQSPPQKVNSPEKLRQQESAIDSSIDSDKLSESFTHIVNALKPSMDEANKAAADVWTTQGTSAMLSHIMTREDGTQMSYAESRYLYG